MKLSAQLLRRNPTGSQKPKTVSCTHNRQNRETEQLPQPATEQHRRVVPRRKAEDEGYKQLAAIKEDPSFAAVIKSPAVQEVLTPRPEDNPQI